MQSNIRYDNMWLHIGWQIINATNHNRPSQKLKQNNQQCSVSYRRPVQTATLSPPKSCEILDAAFLPLSSPILLLSPLFLLPFLTATQGSLPPHYATEKPKIIINHCRKSQKCNKRTASLVFTTWCYAECADATVPGKLSVCPSVCDTKVCFSHRLE